MNDTNKLLSQAFDSISKKWDEDIIPQLETYISIPNKSEMFDPDWKKHGYMHKAMDLIQAWCKKQPIKDMKLELFESDGRSPLLFIEIPGQSDDTILLYGHMDKQPEMTGWDQGLGPWKPVLKGDKLYGRGGADDGYAVFCALTAIATLQENNIPHARCVLIIEASEESGSCDLPHYLTTLKAKIGTPSLVITLDSDCGNYDQLWSTTSLRGLVAGDLKIKVLTEGIHSGFGSGVVPSAFNVLRELLNRIESSETNQFLLDEFHVDIPDYRTAEAQAAAGALGNAYIDTLPFAEKTQPVTHEVAELILNRTWRPFLSITGLDGMPLIKNAGNVTLPELNVKLSIRIPPTCDAKSAGTALKQCLEKNPPFNAVVAFEAEADSPGWHAPKMNQWLIDANEKASQLFYQQPAMYLGGGGSIPFMGKLGDMYPEAQFLITGVLGPKSNAHGPNEFLHIPMVKKLTGCVASVIASHYAR